MVKLENQNKSVVGSGKRIRNNALFSLGMISSMISGLIYDTCSLVSNDILLSKGYNKVEYNFMAPLLRVGSNANNSSILY